VTTLHLGVLDVPYRKPVPAAQRRVSVKTSRGGKSVRRSIAPSGFETTGDVADILEAKYHVMEVFAEETGLESIFGMIGTSMENALKDIAAGAPASISPTHDAEQKIEAAFRQFIDQELMNGIVPGVPTQAAQRGVNHRFLHPYAKGNPARPSFRDTGLYQTSFRAWVD
jgi:hypothetical protein